MIRDIIRFYIYLSNVLFCISLLRKFSGVFTIQSFLESRAEDVDQRGEKKEERDKTTTNKQNKHTSPRYFDDPSLPVPRR